jgi:hypothetical protein
MPKYRPVYENDIFGYGIILIKTKALLIKLLLSMG